MSPRLSRRERKKLHPRPLFAEDNPISARLMRPGILTRMSDKAVSFFSQFEDDEPEKPLVQTDPSEVSRSPIRQLFGIGMAVIAFAIVGRRSEAALFIGTQALMVIGVKAWFDWHRRNPPAKDAASTPRGVLSALIQATIAFAVGVFYLYVLGRSIPIFAADHDWFRTLEYLIVPSGLAVITYQRRTGWSHDDPERVVIIGAIAVVFAILSQVIGLAI
jgi:hypothetical protein